MFYHHHNTCTYFVVCFIITIILLHISSWGLCGRWLFAQHIHLLEIKIIYAILSIGLIPVVWFQVSCFTQIDEEKVSRRFMKLVTLLPVCFLHLFYVDNLSLDLKYVHRWTFKIPHFLSIILNILSFLYRSIFTLWLQ